MASASRVFMAPLLTPSASISWTSGLEISSLDCGPSFWGATGLMGRRMATFLLLTGGGVKIARKIVTRVRISQQPTGEAGTALCAMPVAPPDIRPAREHDGRELEASRERNAVDHAAGGRRKCGAQPSPSSSGRAARRACSGSAASAPTWPAARQWRSTPMAQRHGLAVTRFDYSGHGRSGGDFNDGTHQPLARGGAGGLRADLGSAGGGRLLDGRLAGAAAQPRPAAAR